MIIESLLAEVDKCNERARNLREIEASSMADKYMNVVLANQYHEMARMLENVITYLVTGRVDLD